MDSRATTGRAAEDEASEHLAAAGLTVLARNLRVRGGELDLIALERDTVVFVEVRRRSHAGFGGALASVDTGKRARLVRAAGEFLARNPRYARWPCRFDVVAFDGKPPVLNWHRDAFRLD